MRNGGKMSCKLADRSNLFGSRTLKKYLIHNVGREKGENNTAKGYNSVSFGKMCSQQGATSSQTGC